LALRAAILGLVALAGPLAAQGVPEPGDRMRRMLAQQFQQRLDSVASAGPGVIGVAVEDLSTGERFAVNDSLAFPQASAIKVAILLELLRQSDAGTLALGDRVELRAAQQVGGSGVLQSFADGGSSLSLHDLAVLMITLSDNTATNLLIERVGMPSVNRTLDGLGLGEIRLRRLMIRPAESARGNENVASPRAAARLMARLSTCDLPLSASSCGRMRQILELPKSGTLAGALPAGVPVAWKPGTLQGVSTAWALVRLRGRPFAFSAMVAFGDERANDTVRELARLSHDYFASLAGTTPYGVRVPESVLAPVDSSGVRRAR
ncbi:MAG TPA: serine hydrolase, partial [Gemmatimonadaceae bacterium]|nr:serine hydrolase [Gemmatimonadaceae bacterium]